MEDGGTPRRRLRADYDTFAHVLGSEGEHDALLFRDVRVTCGHPDESGRDEAWEMLATGMSCVRDCWDLIIRLPDDFKYIGLVARDEPGRDFVALDIDVWGINHNMVKSHITLSEIVDGFFKAQTAFRHVTRAVMVPGRKSDRGLFELYELSVLFAERVVQAAAAEADAYADRASKLLAIVASPPLKDLDGQIALRKKMKQILSAEVFASLSENSAVAIRSTINVYRDSAARARRNKTVAEHLRSVSIFENEVRRNTKLALGIKDRLADVSGKWMWWGEDVREEISGLLNDMKDIISYDLIDSIQVQTYRAAVAMVDSFERESGTSLSIWRDCTFWPEKDLIIRASE